ncbi:MAG TPA: tripartite tricarboxylate transporter substrate-binding protein, partial [Roseomonas sp.]|nr:tripartite tricarboxylate transporter substrate-binding protein [Roseomonas sp.]
MHRRSLLAGIASLGAANAAFAQGAWTPDRPIRLVVPFAPGGSTDVTARLVAEAIAPRLGQPVVIENRPGAAGNIGSEAVARAAPDGHTLLMGTSSTHATNVALYRNLPYQPLRDFAPVSQVAFIPNLLVVHPDVPARDLPGLIALARAQPGRL